MNSVYPVGSLYFGTQSTCPLQALGIGTWTKVGSSIITSVNTSVPVKGNGKTIGLTDGAINAGLSVNNVHTVIASQGNYGKPLDGSNTESNNLNYKRLGLTTDPENSGIVGTVTRTALTVNIWKRTA